MSITLDRKGATIEFVALLVAALIGFGAVIGALVQWVGDDEGKMEAACELSIDTRAAAALQFNRGQDADDFDLFQANVNKIPVVCQTIDKKVKGQTQEEIMEVMAQKIAKCWDMFGEGRYEEILDDSDIRAAPALFGLSNKPNKCFNCYNILIDQDEIEDGPIAYEEFIRYLWEHPAKKERDICRGDGCVPCTDDSRCPVGSQCLNGQCDVIKEYNYIEYLQEYGGPGMFVNVIDGSIKPRHAYSISFLPKSVDREQPNLLKWAGLGVGAGSAAAVTFMGCTAITGGLCGVFVAVGVVGVKVATAGVIYDAVTVPEERRPPGTAGIHPENALSVETMFKEREVSAIYLSDSQFGQEYCVDGDIYER